VPENSRCGGSLGERKALCNRLKIFGGKQREKEENSKGES
jgi:hypothetical protein